MNKSTDLATVERKQRWRKFFDMIRPPRHVFLIRYNERAPERPLPHPDKKQQRIEWAWDMYLRHLNRMEWLDDDSIPCLEVYTGTEIFAEAFGCRVHRPDTDMPFALPLIYTATEVSRLKVPDLDTPPLPMLFEMADELRKRAGEDVILRMVDIQSPMDIAALIWDKNFFYSALIESPEAVKELSSKVTELLVAFLDEWFSRYGEEFVAHCPDYYMPKGITLSEDEVGAVDEEMFVEFFLPELVHLSERYGGIGIHCCATARHQWDNFKKILNLRLLNLSRPPEEARAAHSFFASHVPQMHGWCGDDEPWLWPKQYPAHARIVLQVSADTKERALDLSERLRKVLSRE